MTRQDPPLPEGLGKAFINSLMEEFAKGSKMTLEEYLRESDQYVAIEENHLDRAPVQTFTTDEELNGQVQANYQDYRDNKKWLHED